MNKMIAWAAMCLLFSSSLSFAADEANKDAAVTTPEPKQQEVKEGLKGDFGFGAGIGANYLGNAKDISNARVTDGKIEVGSSEGVKTSLWLESHYLFGGDYGQYTCPNCLIKAVGDKEATIKKPGQTYSLPRKFKFGPFFAIQVGSDNQIINGAAVGLMASFLRHKDKTGGGTDISAFNLGVGISSTKYQDLANGLSEGSTADPMTQVTYTTRTRLGALVLFSINVF